MSGWSWSGHWAGVLLACAILGSVGCRTTETAKPGRLALAVAARRLTAGKTTQDEVEAMLGPPKLAQQGRGLTLWRYEEAHKGQISAGAAARLGGYRAAGRETFGYQHMVTLKTLLTVVFDGNGVVVKHQLLEP